MDIQVYAKRVYSHPEDIESLRVSLDGVNIDDVLAEFNVKDILDSLDFSDIAQYVSENNKEAENERSY